MVGSSPFYLNFLASRPCPITSLLRPFLPPHSCLTPTLSLVSWSPGLSFLATITVLLPYPPLLWGFKKNVDDIGNTQRHSSEHSCSIWGFHLHPTSAIHKPPTTPRTLSLPRNTPPLTFRLPNLWLQLSIYPLLYFLILLGPALHPHHRRFPDLPCSAPLHIIYPGFKGLLPYPAGSSRPSHMSDTHINTLGSLFPSQQPILESSYPSYFLSSCWKIHLNMLIGFTRKI